MNKMASLFDVEMVEIPFLIKKIILKFSNFLSSSIFERETYKNVRLCIAKFYRDGIDIFGGSKAFDR
jgi:hypothetical protein